jgi:hypothetical protein
MLRKAGGASCMPALAYTPAPSMASTLVALYGGQSHLRLEGRGVVPAGSFGYRLSWSPAILAVVRQKLHLSRCSDFPRQLSAPRSRSCSRRVEPRDQGLEPEAHVYPDPGRMTAGFLTGRGLVLSTFRVGAVRPDRASVQPPRRHPPSASRPRGRGMPGSPGPGRHQPGPR